MTRLAPLWLQQQSYAASIDRRLVALANPGASSRCTGLAVTTASGMTVNISAGSVVIPSANNTGSILCVSDAADTATLAAAPGSGTNRYDLVIVQARGNDLDGGANNDFVFTTVTGTAAASPTVPAVPSNAYCLAQIYVPGGSASVTAGNITDTRWLSYGPGHVLRQASNPGAGNPSTAAEAIISWLITPVLYIPTATQLVTVRASWRMAQGGTGEGCFIRLREGTTTAGTMIQETVCIFANAGAQTNTGPGGQILRTYAPGIGLKQWCIGVASTTATGVQVFNGTTYPLVLEVVDAGG